MRSYRPPRSKRSQGARKAMATRSARAGALLRRTCSDCRHEVVKRTEHEWSMGGTYVTHTPMCGHGGEMTHTHIMRGPLAPCGPMGQLWEAKEGKEGET